MKKHEMVEPKEMKKETIVQSATMKPTEDQIRRRAFEIYCTRRRNPNEPAKDWLEAESELCHTEAARV